MSLAEPTVVAATAAPQQPDTRRAFLDNLRLLGENDLDAWIDLWDEDGVYELPFAPAGTPQRVQGKAKVREYMRMVLSAMAPVPGELPRWNFWDITIYDTQDPRTVIAEYKGRSQIAASERTYTQTYIARCSTGLDGKILLYREHWNPLNFIDGLGSLENAQRAFADLEFKQ